MITEDFCSFEVARLLKEKGFDECSRIKYCQISDNEIFAVENEQVTIDEGYIPTHQMAMKWLRKKHNIIITPQPEYFSCDRCESWGIDIWAFDNYEKLPGDFPTYEEAVDAALKYSLQNLI